MALLKVKGLIVVLSEDWLGIRRASLYLGGEKIVELADFQLEGYGITITTAKG